MTNLIKVIAAVVDTHNLTLYTVEGETVVIPQGDFRVAKIVEQVTPICAAGGIAEVDISQENPYKELEQQSGGIIKMFRIARAKLAELFASPPVFVEPTQIGDLSKIEQQQKAVAEIMKHAVPAASPDFHEHGLHDGDSHQEDDNEGDTVIAVMGDTILPDAHKLKPQITHANGTNNSMGLQKFIERAAKYKRRHTLEELMRFMHRGDLPIADDGQIIIYKILRRKTNPQYPHLKYVDCHTGQVPQGIGTFVHMDENLVDPDRGQDCSNGLHVARRGYLSGFSGDVVVIAKVSPENVIAVPQYDSNKMRVCGYTILFELSDRDFTELKANRPLTTDEGKQMLAKAISGVHTDVTTLVRIGGHRGTNITITDKTKAEKAVEEKKNEIAPDAPKAEAIKEGGNSAPPVDPKAVSQAVVAVQTSAEQTRALYDAFKKAPAAKKRETAQAVVDFKKAKKKGWSALGISDKEVDTLTKALD